MKTLKRVISCLCVLSLMLCSVGCGNKGENGEEKSGVTQVKVWSNSGGSKSVMTSLVNEYNATIGKEKGIEIVYEVLAGDWGQQVELALTSGGQADIFPTSKLNEHAQNGHLQALEDLEGGEEYIAPFAEKHNLKALDCSSGGKIYSVPNNAITIGLLYNKDMFVNAGIVDENGEAKPPETYEELREYAKKLTNPSKKEYGIIFPVKSGAWFPYEVKYPMMSSVGHDGFDPETNQYDFAPLKPILETIMQIKADGSCYPGAESIDADPARARFAEGGIAMKFGVSWDVGVLTDQFPAKCDWAVAPVPVLDKNDMYKQKMNIYKGLVMSKKNIEEKGADKIFEVFKWLHGNEVQLACYEAEVALPWDSSVIEGKTFENLSENWKAFADMLSISAAAPAAYSVDVTGKESLDSMFINKVWSGNGSIDEVLATWTKTCNDGIKTFRENNPDYDPSIVDNSQLDLKR